MSDGDGPSRNFRSAYYEKLGFCGNEEKNILDLLIASSPFDSEKLSDLCDRFDLDRRCVEAWKVLLGVECGRKNPFDEFANVRRVRAEHFQSLKHHLEVLLRHNLVMRERLKKCSNLKQHDDHHNSHASSNLESLTKREGLDVFTKSTENDIQTSEKTRNVKTSLSKSNDEESLESEKNRPSSLTINIMEEIESNPGMQITLMYLLEVGRLESLEVDAQLDSDYCRKLFAMAPFFVNVSSDLQEAFFLFRNFIKKLEEDEALKESQVSSNKN